MKRVLVHACCACCATVAVERLVEEYHVECLFYNPNIEPVGEYDRRLESMLDFAKRAGVVLYLGLYDPMLYHERVKGHEDDPEGGERCGLCFEMRLARTAEEAVRRGSDCFATTLTVSPHKDAARINAIGAKLAASYGVEYIETDLKKNDGFKRSVELSKEYGLYRQDYCGCVFSMRE